MLAEGSQVIVEHGGGSAKPGDIVVYFKDNRLISHRVIRIRRKGRDKLYLTKGDSALRFDPLIRESEVIGIVRRVIRKGNLIDFRIRKWKIMGRVLAICSFMVGVLSKFMVPFLSIFLKIIRHEKSEPLS